MVYRPFRSIGRFGLAACAVSLGVASLSAQTAPSTPAPVGPNPSRVDIFTGFSYYGAHGQVKPAYINYSSINLGAAGSAAYYFNKYVGAEVQVLAHPDGNNDGLYSAAGGLILRAPMQNFTLFAHGLAGAARLGGPNSEGPLVYHEPYRNGPTVLAGGGMDYDLPFFNNRFSLRLFEADYQYVHEDYGYYVGVPTNGVLGGRANVSGIDLSTGIVTHFGHIIPPHPIEYACVVAPTEVYAGDPVTATGTATYVLPKKTPTYSWTSTGGVVSGTGNVANIDTKDLAPGDYMVKGHVADGTKAGRMADCAPAPFRVKQFDPPHVTCSANPSSLMSGESSTITAAGVSPQNRPLTYSYSASGGNVSGSGSTATLSTTGAGAGTITVTCSVTDDKGQTASDMASVLVKVNTPPPAVVNNVSLCELKFDRTGEPTTRINNESKACLDQAAIALGQESTTTKLYLIGNASTSEKNGPALSAERAANAKYYLVNDAKVDGAKIVVGTGTTDAKTVTTTLVRPDGVPVPVMTSYDEAKYKGKERGKLGAHKAAKKHHKKKK